jgi:hypothetical protein
VSVSDAFRQKALAMARVSTHDAHVEASARYELKNPLNGSGGTTRGARMAANERRRTERGLGSVLALMLHKGRLLDSVGRQCAVVLTRVSPRPFDDDNLAAAFKSIRDGMATRWDIDDGDDAVVWLYDWCKGPDAKVEARIWWLE